MMALWLLIALVLSLVFVAVVAVVVLLVELVLVVELLVFEWTTVDVEPLIPVVVVTRSR
jgi:hypothetical protein